MAMLEGTLLLELLNAAEAVYFDAKPLSYTRRTLGPVLVEAGRVCDCMHRPHVGLCSDCGHIAYTAKGGR